MNLAPGAGSITWPVDKNFIMNHVLGARSSAQPVDQQSSALPLSYSCPLIKSSQQIINPLTWEHRLLCHHPVSHWWSHSGQASAISPIPPWNTINTHMKLLTRLSRHTQHSVLHECFLRYNDPVQMHWKKGCFRPQVCIVRLMTTRIMRWILFWIMPQMQDRLLHILTCSPAHYLCATAAPSKAKQ